MCIQRDLLNHSYQQPPVSYLIIYRNKRQKRSCTIQSVKQGEDQGTLQAHSAQQCLLGLVSKIYICIFYSGQFDFLNKLQSFVYVLVLIDDCGWVVCFIFLAVQLLTSWAVYAQTYLQLPLRQWGAGNVYLLKALVVKNSVLHDFGFGKVSPAKQL